MKKVLVVGFIRYEEEQKLRDKYSDVLWFEVIDIGNSRSPEGICETVKIMDEVLFTDENYIDKRIGWEVACVMWNKKVVTLKDYPVEEEEEKGEA